ncbi:short-chain dehydrogenase [Aestuariivirga litoralis]|uniref:Short-chain dehydrogenase n=1 Tax=Aestuariivirga litoralis TaxID=2650924 RepID=A0A2W2AJ51_9HYPH|nr:SDR family oxidoreductase [Aestuariivirga litoralis]PZF75321.1 short-chain dehydrogenase [Aestuariivirga litoralis]
MNIESLRHLSMDGKTAVVTGSTQGLGEAIAHLFADRGVSQMVITGRNAERGARVKAALEAKGVKTVFVPADLVKLDEVRQVIAACDAAFGRIDALVNAAALTDRGTIWDTSEARYDELFDANVKAPFFLMQDALHLMKKSRTSGTIVNILSMSGHGGQDFLTAYSTTKGALAVMTKNVAYSVMKYRIRVNGLNIGWMDTPGEDRIMKTYHDAAPGWLKEAEAGRPFGRLLKPAEVARACAYLSSEESGLMTGSIIDFDQQVMGAGNSPSDPPDATW